MFLLVTQWQKKGVFDLCDAIITERRWDFRRKSGGQRLEAVLRADWQRRPVERNGRLEVDATPRLFPVAIAGRLRAFGAAILLGSFGRFNVLGGVGDGDWLRGQRRLLGILAHAAHFYFGVHGWGGGPSRSHPPTGPTGNSRQRALAAQEEHSGLYFSGFIMPVAARERNEPAAVGANSPSGIEP